LILAAALVLYASVASSGDTAPAPPSARAELGRRIFFDPALSEPRGTSCASCHDPARAYSGDHGSGVGVPAGSRPGVLARRNTPSLYYLRYVPTLRFHADEDNRRSFDLQPYGGYFWDGRSDSIAELVRQPLLNPREMNNRDVAQIADKLRRAPYARAFQDEFPGALDAPETAVQALGVALEAFLTSRAMAPFTSKFDDYLRRQVTLTAQEAEGLRLFKDPRRGNCADCHTVRDASPIPELSLFTDYSYEAVGAPRNARLRTHDEDRGLCERTDATNPSTESRFCARFRTPSLRNVARRPSFMHNGAFTNLRDVVRFYATRSTNPERWYPSGVPFDDTPEAYRAMVNTTKVPYDRHPGDPPALDDHEIDAIVAFLRTLTDRPR
jgi:cytochrome c peroxidase